MQVIHKKHKDYPKLLGCIHNAPDKIYVAGTIPQLPMVAIVGTRRPTSYGEMVAYRIASDLARAGICIISGLAYGIDSIVHRAVLEAGGATLAVLGSGLNNCYPRNHLPLMKEIITSGGGVISEYDADTPPLKHHFPARNRIIAGMSDVTLVVEAEAKSGSLITAQLALEEGRTVLAVPGPITSSRSDGPNNLLKAGAGAVTSAADICSLIGIENIDPAQPPTSTSQISSQARLILVSLNESPKTTEDLATSIKLSPAVILSTLTLLEMQGQVRATGANTWISTVNI